MALARYFDEVVAAGAAPKLASNWITGEIARRLNAQGIAIEAAPVSAAQLAQLVSRIADGTISNAAARQVFEELWGSTTVREDGTRQHKQLIEDSAVAGDELLTVDQIIEAKGLKQMNDSGALEAIVDEVIAANPGNVEQFKAGKDKAFNALVGQVMKASKGKANPQQATDLLRTRLGG